MEKISLYIIYFFFYSAIGWFFESAYCSIPAKKWINRGFLSGPMCPIYGTGALTMIVLLTPLYNHPIYISAFGQDIFFTPVIVAITGMVLCDIVEYFTSLILEKLFHAHWWDYSGKLLNIQGRICLTHTIIWGIAALVFMYYVHPFIDGYAQQIPIRYIYCALAFIAIVFVADLINSVHKAMDVKAVMDKFRKLNTKINSISNTIYKSLDNRLVFRTGTDKPISISIERFNQIRDEMTEQVRESFKRLRTENRLLKGYPNLSKTAKKQLHSIEELLQEIKSRIFDEDNRRG